MKTEPSSDRKKRDADHLPDPVLNCSGAVPVNTMSARAFHRAKWVMVSPWDVMENAVVAVVNGTIVDVFKKGRGSLPAEKGPHVRSGSQSGKMRSEADSWVTIDHGDGVLMPGLINAHTHFELSALAGKVPVGNGFEAWVKALIMERERLDDSDLIQAAEQAMQAVYHSGTLAAAEISTLGITRLSLENSALDGVWFQEELGGLCSPTSAHASVFRAGPCNGVFSSSAGHAPHTTSPRLLKTAFQAGRYAGTPFSIHVGESDEELEFIQNGRGRWAEFLGERGIGFTHWPLPADGPVHYLEKLGVLGPDVLAVHLIHADESALSILSRRRVRPVLCPRSNLALHGRAADPLRFLKAGLRPALGTDSLAGTPSLDLFHEMAEIQNRFPDIAPDQIIAMATLYGAEALKCEYRYGTLEAGKSGRFIHVPVTAESKEQVLEAVASAGRTR